MNINHYINWAIYNFPTLYRCGNYADSRLRVLSHLFLTNGNGMEWTRDGYLTDCMGRDDRSWWKRKLSHRQTRWWLPYGFFKRNLYTMDVPKGQYVDGIHVRYHYVSNSCRLVYEAMDEDDARPIARQFQMFPSDYCVFIQKATAHETWDPYPICEYAALVEILNGKTCGLSDEAFEFTPKFDWLAGCVEVAKAAMAYYKDETRFVGHHYHAKRTLPQMQYAEKDAKRAGKEPHWVDQLRSGETLEQFVQRRWEDYRNEQISILRDFLKKYA